MAVSSITSRERKKPGILFLCCLVFKGPLSCLNIGSSPVINLKCQWPDVWFWKFQPLNFPFKKCQWTLYFKVIAYIYVELTQIGKEMMKYDCPLIRANLFWLENVVVIILFKNFSRHDEGQCSFQQCGKFSRCIAKFVNMIVRIRNFCTRPRPFLIA